MSPAADKPMTTHPAGEGGIMKQPFDLSMFSSFTTLK